MKKILWILIPLLFIQTVSVFANNEEEYKSYAENIRKLVWDSDLPEFKHPKPTNRFNKYPAVFLACYEEYAFDLKEESLLQRGKRSSTHLNRHMVQINDETALKAYSEFDFKAYAKRGDIFTGKMEMRRVLGVRVIKPDGSIQEVNTDDYILSSEGQKNKDVRQRLAVPGLAVGDIIDYFTYLYNDEFAGYVHALPFYFVDKYPMMSYRIHCEFPYDMAIRYRTLNGAPDFTRSTNGQNAYTLDVRVKDVERTEPDLWYNYSIQSPHTILLFNESYSSSIIQNTMQKGILSNPDFRLFQTDAWAVWDATGIGVSKEDKAAIKEAIEKYQDQEKRADFIYEHCAAIMLEERLTTLNENTFIQWLAECFKKAGIKYQSGITTTDKHEPMESLIDFWHVTRFIRLSDNKYYFPPMFACWPGEVPRQLQGRQAVVCINPNQKLKKGPYLQIFLPQTTIEDNVEHNDIKAKIEDLTVDICRSTKKTGALRQEASLIIPTREELVQSYSKTHQLMQNRQSLHRGKNKDIIQESNENDIKTQKKVFRDEITTYHNAEPSKVNDCHLITVGTTKEQPALHYQTNYMMEGMVKRAGNNMLLAVGRMLGSEMKIEGQQRERKDDIIRVSPSLYTWDIEVEIPEGYQITTESLENIQAQYSNDCGSFSVKVSSNEKKLYMKAEKRIFHKRESIEKWPQLLELYDRIYNYLSQQIILVKVN